MTRATSARIAGATFLFYIAAGVAGMAVAVGPALSVLLSLGMGFSALVLAVTLYAITRAEDPDIARLGLVCRVAEGVIGAAFMPASLALGSIASAPDAEAARVLAGVLRTARLSNVAVSATFFAVGSACFCWLLLRGRMIPVALAWLGVLASLLLVVALPLQLGGVLHGAVTQLVWLPMAAFEIPLAFWLLARGVR